MFAFVREIGAVDGEGNPLYGLTASTSCPCWCADAHIGRLRPWRRHDTHTRSEGTADPGKTNAAPGSQGAIRSTRSCYPIHPRPLPKASSKHCCFDVGAGYVLAATSLLLFLGVNVGRPRTLCGAGPRPFFYVLSGGVLLSHILTNAVPSALWVLASGFGMGPGVSPTL